MTAAKKPGPRAARRAEARAAAKLGEARVRLSLLEPGGSAGNPIEVSTASLVEARARSMPCPRCAGELRLEEHTAEVIDGSRLRVARMACAVCGAERRLYFRLGTTLAN